VMILLLLFLLPETRVILVEGMVTLGAVAVLLVGVVGILQQVNHLLEGEVVINNHSTGLHHHNEN